jgi:capsular polysaccharide transport system permease protein
MLEEYLKWPNGHKRRKSAGPTALLQPGLPRQMQQTTADPMHIPRAQEPKGRRFRTARVVMALILREIGSRESRSSLGFLWAIIDPIATVAILSLAFSLLTKTPRLGTNFPLYYITGVVPFQVYAQTSNRMANAVRFSRTLLGFPAVTVLDTLMARFLLNFLINIVVFFILVVGVVNWYGLRVNIDMTAVISSLLLAGALGIGVGTFNSVLFLFFPAYENLWGMFNRPMMIASGAMVFISDLPEWLFNILKWNPAAHVVSEMRRGFYGLTYDAPWVEPSYVVLCSAITFTIGLITLHRYVYDALDR